MKLDSFFSKNGGGLFRKLADDIVPLMGLWAERTVSALNEEDCNAVGYRDLYTNKDNFSTWYYPRSNAAERINAFLFLHEFTGEQKYFNYAVRYADIMSNDTEKGIYRGKYEAGHGLVWYWRDVGTYMTNYTMRVPGGMLALYKKTGNEFYKKMALLSGEALIRFQHETGILKEGWYPPEVDQDIAGQYVTEYKINSRIGFAVDAFARLAKFTGDAKYFDAMEKLCDGMLAVMYQDGSLPGDIYVDKPEAYDKSKKGHFMNYVINGIGNALEIFPENKKLRLFGQRLGEYLNNCTKQSWGSFYGNIYELNNCEPEVWQSSSAEASGGLVKTGKVLGRDDFVDSAMLLAINAMLRVIDSPENPDFHGALPIWVDPAQLKYPQIGGYFHFYSLLGIGAILA